MTSEEIIRLLADSFPVYAMRRYEDEHVWLCTLCSYSWESYPKAEMPTNHAKLCPWRLAHEHMTDLKVLSSQSIDYSGRSNMTIDEQMNNVEISYRTHFSSDPGSSIPHDFFKWRNLKGLPLVKEFYYNNGHFHIHIGIYAHSEESKRSTHMKIEQLKEIKKHVYHWVETVREQRRRLDNPILQSLNDVNAERLASAITHTDAAIALMAMVLENLKCRQEAYKQRDV